MSTNMLAEDLLTIFNQVPDTIHGDRPFIVHEMYCTHKACNDFIQFGRGIQEPVASHITNAIRSDIFRLLGTHGNGLWNPTKDGQRPGPRMNLLFTLTTTTRVSMIRDTSTLDIMRQKGCSTRWEWLGFWRQTLESKDYIPLFIFIMDNICFPTQTLLSPVARSQTTSRATMTPSCAGGELSRQWSPSPTMSRTHQQSKSVAGSHQRRSHTLTLSSSPEAPGDCSLWGQGSRY